MTSPFQLSYTPFHEWIEIQQDLLIVGLTERGQELLGPITFLEIAALGKDLKEGQELAMIETNKTAQEIGSPVRGRVVARNPAVIRDPSQINRLPYQSWIAKIFPLAAPSSPFLGEAAYRNLDDSISLSGI